MKLYKFKPNYATSPGNTLADWMLERNIGMIELSEKTGIKTLEIYDILKGNIKIDISIAEKLEKGTKIPSHLWMNLQRKLKVSCPGFQDN